MINDIFLVLLSQQSTSTDNLVIMQTKIYLFQKCVVQWVLSYIAIGQCEFYHKHKNISQSPTFPYILQIYLSIGQETLSNLPKLSWT